METEELELTMVIYPDKRLREKCIGLSEEETKRDSTREVAEAMIRAMYKYGGVGLAAQQVGYPGAMFVTDAHWPETGKHDARI